jgi:uncharacterized small protein (DUF1192 family)
MPQVGDKVYPANSKMLYEINHVSHDGAEVNLHVPGTNLERFRVRTNSLTFAERKPPARTSNPFTSPEPVLDVDEILKRIATVQEENLKRLDDDIDILKAYLKTQRAPKTALEALEYIPICRLIVTHALLTARSSFRFREHRGEVAKNGIAH